MLLFFLLVRQRSWLSGARCGVAAVRRTARPRAGRL